MGKRGTYPEEESRNGNGGQEDHGGYKVGKEEGVLLPERHAAE